MRRKRTPIYLSAAEQLRLRVAADNACMSMSGYVRTLVPQVLELLHDLSNSNGVVISSIELALADTEEVGEFPELLRMALQAAWRTQRMLRGFATREKVEKDGSE